MLLDGVFRPSLRFSLLPIDSDELKLHRRRRSWHSSQLCRQTNANEMETAETNWADQLLPIHMDVYLSAMGVLNLPVM